MSLYRHSEREQRRHGERPAGGHEKDHDAAIEDEVMTASMVRSIGFLLVTAAPSPAQFDTLLPQ